MVGQTLIQKILAKASGKETEGVVENEIVFVSPHRILSHDNSAAISKTFYKMVGPNGKIWGPEKIFIALDHAVPPPDAVKAGNHTVIRKFVKDQGIKYFYEGGTGICHEVLPAKGHVPPNVVILGSDSHTTTHGAFGAAGIPIGRTETASVWAIGETWLKVPESIKIILDGSLPKGVYAKDVILEIIRQITAAGATYNSIEFYGSSVKKLSMSERMTLSNLTAEMGAKAGIFPVDDVTDEWNKQFGFQYDRITADEDAKYIKTLELEVSNLTPRIAKPHKVDNVVPIEELGKTTIDVALIGTCTNGRLDDLEIAANILKDKTIHPNIRLLVYPASQEILLQATREGILEILVAAGGQIGVPACGPCLGAYGGCIASGEKAISSANRNFKGRMGSKEDTGIYLASPATVAKSALAGYITAEES
ncbi:3-isopropylmalate dehydratase large subunit [Candidatus Heimdallarchaeota archaeon B3_Heim]|nr:MAG: 3-isopropylmalate dehydratase large subunit [Candidatus Heimdallarchaeota archaeon B3_Heim]